MKFKKITAALLSAFMIGSSFPVSSASFTASAASAGWAAAYEKTLNSLNSRDTKFLTGYVNDDDIPELFVAESWIHAAAVSIYTYSGGEIKFLGYYGSYGHCYYKEKKNLMYSFDSGMGMAYYNIDSINNGASKTLINLSENYDFNPHKYYIGKYPNEVEISASKFAEYQKKYSFDSSSISSLTVVDYEKNMVPITSSNIKKYIYDLVPTTSVKPSAPTPVPSVSKCSFGDVSGDGVINAVDASYVLTAYSLKATGNKTGFTSAQRTAADVNKDGVYDALDASAILSYYSYTATGGRKTLKQYMAK